MPVSAMAPMLSMPRGSGLTREQIQARRYEDWRIAHDEGIPNEFGEIERRSISLIAATYGASRKTVWEGIHRARTIRVKLQERLANIDGELDPL